MALGRVKFRDGYVCTCVAESLPWVELDMLQRGLIKSHIDIIQYGYQLTTGDHHEAVASKGTHDLGGCIDVAQYHVNQITVWREWGWTMQRRDLKGVPVHGHGWPYQCGHLSDGAEAQERDWNRKDAGLMGDAQVVGMWPVKPWYKALEDKMATVLDNAKKEIATQVLGQDGEILNKTSAGELVFSDGAGDFISLKNAVYEMGKDLMQLKKDLALIKAAVIKP